MTFDARDSLSSIGLPSATLHAAGRWGGLALAAWLGAAALEQAARARVALARWRATAPPPAFEQRLPRAAARVLVVGDSTGVGAGAADPAQALAGRLARQHPQVDIVNRSRLGACLADVPAQIDAASPPGAVRFDLALLHIGGNDVLKALRLAPLERQADAVLRRLQRAAARVVWLGPANLGLAPVFIPPFNWWLSRRTRAAARCYARAARRRGVEFIPFDAREHSRVFLADRARYFAPDGLHPSSEAYGYCYQRLRRSPAIRQALDATPGRETLGR